MVSYSIKSQCVNTCFVLFFCKKNFNMSKVTCTKNKWSQNIGRSLWKKFADQHDLQWVQVKRPYRQPREGPGVPWRSGTPSNSSQLISGVRSIYPTSHPVQGLAVGFVIMFRCSHGGQLLVGRLKLQVPFCLRLRRLGEWNYLAHPQSYARLFSCSFGGSKRSIHVTTCTSLPTYAFLCFGALKGCLVNSDFLRSCKTYNVILHELFENFRKNAVMN